MCHLFHVFQQEILAPKSKCQIFCQCSIDPVKTINIVQQKRRITQNAVENQFTFL